MSKHVTKTIYVIIDAGIISDTYYRMCVPYLLYGILERSWVELVQERLESAHGLFHRATHSSLWRMARLFLKFNCLGPETTNPPTPRSLLAHAVELR